MGGFFVAFCPPAAKSCCKADRALSDEEMMGRTAPNTAIDACLGIVAHTCCRFHAVQRETPVRLKLVMSLPATLSCQTLVQVA